MKISNFYYDSDSGAMLSKEEVDVIVAVVSEAYKMDSLRDKNGSFVLFGTQKGEAPKKICSFDLERGPIKNYDDTKKDSNAYACKILERVGKDMVKGCIIFNYMKWFYCTPIIMRLETSFGQLVAAFLISIEDWWVYFAIAEAFACLRREDEVTVKSVDEMFKKELRHDRRVRYIQCYIDNLFEEEEKIPEIKEWEKWCDAKAEK